MPRTASEDVQKAKIVIASPEGGDLQELFNLARRLKQEDRFGYARRVLEKAHLQSDAGSDLRVSIVLELALCTYKDPDLPVDERLKKAAHLVDRVMEGAMTPQQQQEAWGISGAVYKQRFAVYGMKRDLETALSRYLNGYKLGIGLDAGYTAINAAFVLDLLADQERNADGSPSEAANTRWREAEQIRQQTLETLPRLAEDDPSLLSKWWFLVTLGEASLGSGRYDQAREWMQIAAAYRPENWQLESTARQVAHLARLQARKEGLKPDELEKSHAWSVVSQLLGGNAVAARSFFRGKVGLALSGGGFRASLYHIGVLAKLAELDMLRHVEVLSCVSGGSILGAYYYLELRHLLQTKADHEITQQDYIELIQRVEQNFLAGVQRNLRMRMLAGFSSNAKVFTSRQSSTTHRLGELYERELYSRIQDGQASRERYLEDLIIYPKDTTDFHPKYDNWERSAKVPILVLNATTLNTCHLWQFTASYMGEPPARAIETEIDGNDRLRRMYHDEAPPQYRRMRLGQAVAASACVPGLFDPLVLPDLYQQGYVTRLVDGGVYDNQGAATLREQDCTVLLVSDACGQTSIQKRPSSTHLGVPTRANSILMARVRETQYQFGTSLRDSSLLRGLMYIHLKKDLEPAPVDWIDCPDPSPPHRPSVLTRYGIRKDVQTMLAAVRTDLDSFSDAEADALMLSGYRMTEYEFPRCIDGFPVPDKPQAAWRFLRLHDLAGSPGGSPELDKLKRTLSVAESLAFKAWRLSPGLKALAAILFIVGLVALVSFCRAFWTQPVQLMPLGVVVTGVTVAVAAIGLLKFLLVRFRYHNSLLQIATALLMCMLGWLFLHLHLRFIDPIYLRWGPNYRGERRSRQGSFISHPDR